MFIKTHMKRNELPITQKSLNKATQTFHVQQTNDTRSHGNNIRDREAESEECEQIHFPEARKGTCSLKRISWIKLNTLKKTLLETKHASNRNRRKPGL